MKPETRKMWTLLLLGPQMGKQSTVPGDNGQCSLSTKSWKWRREMESGSETSGQFQKFHSWTLTWNFRQLNMTWKRVSSDLRHCCQTKLPGIPSNTRLETMAKLLSQLQPGYLQLRPQWVKTHFHSRDRNSNSKWKCSQNYQFVSFFFQLDLQI